MKAARLHEFGTTVVVDEVPEPETAPSDEVLVEIQSVSLNPMDLWVSEGTVAGGTQQLPFVPGIEGVAFRDGTPVIVNGDGLGVLRDGLCRERAVVPVSALYDIPTGVSLHDASCASVVGITAKCILDLAATKPGEVVLILGASGGVGVVAIQVAKLLGATVIAATTSPERRETLLELGADDIVVVGADGQLELPDADVDVVLNPLGGHFVASGLDALASGGRQVLFGRSASKSFTLDTSAFYRKGAILLGYGGLAVAPADQAAARRWILERLADRSLRMPIASIFSLTESADAFAALATNRTPGKIVIQITPAQ